MLYASSSLWISPNIFLQVHPSSTHISELNSFEADFVAIGLYDFHSFSGKQEEKVMHCSGFNFVSVSEFDLDLGTLGRSHFINLAGKVSSQCQRDRELRTQLNPNRNRNRYRYPKLKLKQKLKFRFGIGFWVFCFPFSVLSWGFASCWPPSEWQLPPWKRLPLVFVVFYRCCCFLLPLLLLQQLSSQQRQAFI